MIYVLTLVAPVRNTYALVYKQQRYKLIGVSIFYFCAIVFVLIRISTFVATSLGIMNNYKIYHAVMAMLRSATLIKYIMLLQVSGSMCDFAIRMQSSVQIAKLPD